MDRDSEQIHAICQHLRSHQYAGIVDDIAKCYNCPMRIDTPYGEGTQGCFLLAKELRDISRKHERGLVPWGIKPLTFDIGLGEPVQFKNESDRKGFIVCIHASFSGITYEVCETDGTITQADGAEIEPRAKP